MEKHITLVGVLNIVYRSVAVLGGLILLLIAMGFDRFMEMLMKEGILQPYDVPAGLLEIVPVILAVVGLVMIAVSAVGIAGAAGVLKRKPWGRILLLIVSFFNLVRIPLGTILGAYSIWVLMNDETVRLFNPPPPGPPPAAVP
jgi:hypothetical protein